MPDGKKVDPPKGGNVRDFERRYPTFRTGGPSGLLLRGGGKGNVFGLRFPERPLRASLRGFAPGSRRGKGPTTFACALRGAAAGGSDGSFERGGFSTPGAAVSAEVVFGGDKAIRSKVFRRKAL